MNYFKLFEIKEQYNIDQGLLLSKYLKMQSEFHPDKALTDKDKAEYMQKSVIINDAFNILRDDLKRAEHILSLHGYIVNKEDSNIKPTVEILTEALHAQEKLDDIEDNKDQLEAFLHEQQDNFIRLVSFIGRSYLESEWEKMALATIQLKYTTKLLQDIKEKLKQYKLV